MTYQPKFSPEDYLNFLNGEFYFTRVKIPNKSYQRITISHNNKYNEHGGYLEIGSFSGLCIEECLDRAIMKLKNDPGKSADIYPGKTYNPFEED